MHIGLLVTNTDDSDFAARHPRDAEKFSVLLAGVRPDWDVSAFDLPKGEFPDGIQGFDGFVIGGSPARALELHDGFQQMIQGKGEISLDEDTYEDAVAFEGVAKFVGRVKCAMLGWAAVRDALLQATAMEGKS